MKKILFCLNFSFLLIVLACNNNGKIHDHKLNADLEDIIYEDVQKGPSDSANWIGDAPGRPAKKYIVDKEHSSISFRTKHWEIVDIIGWFSDFDVIMYTDSLDFSDAEIYARVDPRSVTMPNYKMAGSVIRYPYIDTDKYKFANFRSSEFRKTGNEKYILNGFMSLNGIEKEMSFDVLFNGYAYPGEKSICGFDIQGSINRAQFEIGGDDMLHSGRKVHDDIIYIFLSLRME